jgi:hypothetical protein
MTENFASRLIIALLSDIITYIFIGAMVLISICYLRKPERQNENELLRSNRYLHRHSQFMTSLQRTDNVIQSHNT